MCSEPAARGRYCPRSVSGAPVQSMRIFCAGRGRGFLWPCGRLALLSMMTWKALPGVGKASMGPWSRLRRPWRQAAQIRPTGGKSGTKRPLLADGGGVPLSTVVTGATHYDVRNCNWYWMKSPSSAPISPENYWCATESSQKPKWPFCKWQPIVSHIEKLDLFSNNLLMFC
jgi:hypothetical protein